MEIKDFIVTVNEEQEETRKVKKTTNVTMETVVVSGPDFVLRRKTAKSSKLMAVIMSAEQYYIKDEKTGTIQELTEELFTSFLKGAGEYVEIKDENGVSPFWITRIENCSASRRNFMYVIKHPIFREYACRNYAAIPEDRPSGRNSFWIRRNYYNDSYSDGCINDVPEHFDFVLKVMDKLTSHEAVKCALNCLRDGHGGTVHEKISSVLLEMKHNGKDSFVNQVAKKYGLDGVREMLEKFFTSPVTTLPKKDFIQLYYSKHKTLYRKGGGSFVVSCNRETVFDKTTLLNYIFYGSVEQGYADEVDNFIELWADYLNLSYKLYGRIDEKYPKYLASEEHILSYKVSEQRNLEQNKGMENIGEVTEIYEDKSDSTFMMLSPHSVSDLVDEKTQQSNCVTSYLDEILAGNCYIFFCRKKEAPEKSYVTVEVCVDDLDGEIAYRLGQVKAKYNRDPEPEALKYVQKWFEKNFGANVVVKTA